MTFFSLTLPPITKWLLFSRGRKSLFKDGVYEQVSTLWSSEGRACDLCWETGDEGVYLYLFGGILYCLTFLYCFLFIFHPPFLSRSKLTSALAKEWEQYFRDVLTAKFSSKIISEKKESHDQILHFIIQEYSMLNLCMSCTVKEGAF